MNKFKSIKHRVIPYRYITWGFYNSSFHFYHVKFLKPNRGCIENHVVHYITEHLVFDSVLMKINFVDSVKKLDIYYE